VFLLRILSLDVKPAPPALQGLNVDLGDVTVELVPIGEKDGRRTYTAVGRAKLERRPKRTGQGEVVVPDDAREALGYGLEIVANVFSLIHHASRRLASPIPYVAFEAESESERKWLEESAGIEGGLDGLAINWLGHSLDGDDPSVAEALTDRWDGVALFSEALSSERATGRFIDFMRLFERAFRLSPGELSGPLRRFLDPRFGYAAPEVRHWTDTLRGATAHADRRANFMLDRDVRPYLHRVEQAAWDVLQNKRAWRDRGTERRQVWSPIGGTTSASGGHRRRRWIRDQALDSDARPLG
jgi:hypothetical protein